jgi:hypothetical protein
MQSTIQLLNKKEEATERMRTEHNGLIKVSLLKRARFTSIILTMSAEYAGTDDCTRRDNEAYHAKS